MPDVSFALRTLVSYLAYVKNISSYYRSNLKQSCSCQTSQLSIWNVLAFCCVQTTALLMLPVAHKYDFAEIIDRCCALVTASLSNLNGLAESPSSFLTWLQLAEQLQLDVLKARIIKAIKICHYTTWQLISMDARLRSLTPDTLAQLMYGTKRERVIKCNSCANLAVFKMAPCKCGGNLTLIWSCVGISSSVLRHNLKEVFSMQCLLQMTRFLMGTVYSVFRVFSRSEQHFLARGL